MGKPFVKGDPRAGRNPGSRVRLTNSFLNDVLDAWEEGGKDALKIFRIENPDRFCGMVASLVPREFMIESALSDLPDDEIELLIAEIRERRAKLIEQPKPLIEALANGRTAVTVNAVSE